MESQLPVTRTKNKQLFKIGGLAVILLLLASGNILQYMAGKSADERVNTLTKAKTGQMATNKTLSKKNATLAKTIASLQKQASDAGHNTSSDGRQSGDAATDDTSAQVAAVGKMTISKVELVDFAVLSQPFATKSTGKPYAVTLTFTNLTATTQAYGIFDFAAVTNDGAVLQPYALPSYPDNFGSTVWNNSSLAAGASKEVTLYFSPTTPLTSLEWKPKAATSAIVSILPVAG